jgi:hypothetical protein
VRETPFLRCALKLIRFCSGDKSGNAQFARDVAAWTFQEKLVLRIDSTTHHLVNETAPREHYTINENIVRLPLPFP